MSGRNPRGGKAFKKVAKKALDGNAGRSDTFSGLDGEQEYARVLVMLGNRRVRALCNDGVERVLKIRGKLCQRGRNKKIIRVGDLVIYSARQFSDDLSSTDDDDERGKRVDIDICDLIDRVEPDSYRQVRKEPGVNAILFQQELKGSPTEDIFEDGAAPVIAPPETIKVNIPDEEMDIDAI